MHSSDIKGLVDLTAAWLHEHHLRLVLAESCTAGLVSAWLARRAGISQFLCGSMVTYRDATKQSWLQVPGETLQIWSAVSQPVTEGMAVGVLTLTPEATVAVAVTGHLGPNAPTELDGRIFLSAALRSHGTAIIIASQQQRLEQKLRYDRQQEAAFRTLNFLRTLDLPSTDAPPAC